MNFRILTEGEMAQSADRWEAEEKLEAERQRLRDACVAEHSGHDWELELVHRVPGGRDVNIADIDQAMADVAGDLAETVESVRGLLAAGDDPGKLWYTLVAQMQLHPTHMGLALGALAILRLAQAGEVQS